MTRYLTSPLSEASRPHVFTHKASLLTQVGGSTLHRAGEPRPVKGWGWRRGPPRSQNFTTKLAGPTSEVGRANSRGDPQTRRRRPQFERSPPAPTLAYPASDLRRPAAVQARPTPARSRAMPSSILTRYRRPPLTWLAGIARPAPHRRPWSGRSQRTPTPSEGAGRNSPAAESSARLPERAARFLRNRGL